MLAAAELLGATGSGFEGAGSKGNFWMGEVADWLSFVGEVGESVDESFVRFFLRNPSEGMRSGAEAMCSAIGTGTLRERLYEGSSTGPVLLSL